MKEWGGTCNWCRLNSIGTVYIPYQGFVFKKAWQLAVLLCNEIHAEFLLEYDEIRKIVLLRSTLGGSMEPILTYLFKGGLILESLFKFYYPNLRTMGQVNNEPTFVARYGRIDTTAHSLNDIVLAITGNNVANAFNTTGKLRNTTGHNLQWDDVFDNVANFDQLYKQQVNAAIYFMDGNF